jgi:hypothetical protein
MIVWTVAEWAIARVPTAIGTTYHPRRHEGLQAEIGEKASSLPELSIARTGTDRFCKTFTSFQESTCWNYRLRHDGRTEAGLRLPPGRGRLGGENPAQPRERHHRQEACSVPLQELAHDARHVEHAARRVEGDALGRAEPLERPNLGRRDLRQRACAGRGPTIEPASTQPDFPTSSFRAVVIVHPAPPPSPRQS